MKQTDNRANYLPGETNAHHVGVDKELIEEELSYINRMRNGQGKETAPHIQKLLNAVRGEQTGGDKSEGDKSGGDKPYLAGLALSGGGIRSATFALGILQRLARARILENMDYLSTVSGGGYIGSALTWWLSGSQRTGSTRTYDLGSNFPYGTVDPKFPDSDTSPILRYLRENGQYLVPGNGISIWSGTAIIIRAILLNLLVWIPLAGLLLLGLIKAGNLPFLNGLTAMVGSMTDTLLRVLRDMLDSTGTLTIEQIFPPVFLLMLVVAVFLLAIFLVSSINYSLLAWMERGEAAKQRLVKTHMHKLDYVGMQEAAARKGLKNGQSGKSNIKPWLLVGLVCLADIGILVITLFWLEELVGPLFGAEPFPAEMVGRLWALWPGSLILTVCGGFAFFRLSVHEGQSLKDWYGLRNLFIGFTIIFLLDGLLTVAVQLAGSSQPHQWLDLARLSGALQFGGAIGFVVLANFWVAFLVRHLLQIDGMSIRYAGRRVFERFFGTALPICVGLIALGILPIVDAWVGIEYAGMEGAASIIAGVSTALWGHVQSRGTGSGGKRTELVLTIGSALLVYGILLLGFRLASWFEAGDTPVRTVLAAWCMVAVIIGWFTNINYVSLHRFYRDRLMEAFLPDPETVTSGVSGPARRADEMRISEVWDPNPGSTFGPLHIVNTNVVLVNSKMRKYRVRGGDSFMLSPIFCGSNATGWQRSDTVMDGDLTLASAMATSGAAANPRAGVGGRGVTRNHFLSLVMTLLNFRLGYWIARPSNTELVKRRPNHFNPSGWFSIPSVGYSETDSFLELSDGGHFENLGMYELVRRRCGLIIVCDGGHDSQTAYADFLTALQRIEQDFGATVSFDVTVGQGSDAKPSGPEQLIARASDGTYPKGAEYAEKGYFVATIDYGERRGGGPWPEKGILIYLKTTMIEGMSMKARGYKGANPDFPDESTADQFFDEEQFEAYREVGYRIADQMVNDLDLAKLMAFRPALEKLYSNGRFKVG